MLKLLSKSTAPKIPELAAVLKRDVYDLCLPEGRVVGTRGHENAVSFLRRRLGEVGCVPYDGSDFGLPYRGSGENFTNLIGVVSGRDRSLAPLLVGAH